MTFTFARTMLFCLALALPGTAAMASNNPIPGVDIIVRKNPGNNLMIHTDGRGQARLERLVPGNYTLTIRGGSLVAAMDRLAAPARRSGGIEIVGRGRQASSGHEGAAPVPERRGGYASYGHQTIQTRRAGSSAGDSNGDGRAHSAARGGSAVQIIVDLGPAGRFSTTAPYRRDHPGEGLTLAFTIRNHGGARPSVAGGNVTISAISDQASAGNLTSY